MEWLESHPYPPHFTLKEAKHCFKPLAPHVFGVSPFTAWGYATLMCQYRNLKQLPTTLTPLIIWLCTCWRFWLNLGGVSMWFPELGCSYVFRPGLWHGMFSSWLCSSGRSILTLSFKPDPVQIKYPSCLREEWSSKRASRLLMNLNTK